MSKRIAFRIAFFICATLLASFSANGVEGEKPQDLTLKAADGVTIYGKYYGANHPKAVILLFHQAGSNSAEYATIAPRLVQEGYSALAIDQRSGDNMFEHVNETVKKAGHSAEYFAVSADLEAALAYAEDKHLPIAVWGSSYSASLVFLLASRHPNDIKAVLAFSPGEYLGTPGMVQAAAAKVDLPIYVTSAKDKEEIASAKTILAASPSKMKTQFIPKIAGVHGSSTLLADHNPKGNAENWQAVLAFLNGVFK